MNLLSLTLLVCTITTVKMEQGSFWHVTDMHHDIYYDESKQANEVCPSSSGVDTINAGKFGDYRCDSPWNLITSAVNEMHNIQPNPEFIIWTGDDVMHTFDEEKYLGEDVVFDIVKNQSQLLKDTFPNTPIYPCLGNHDMHLKSQFPVDFASNALMQKITDLWCDLYFNEFQCQQFRIGGYYKVPLVGSPQVVLLALNTPLWYSSNHLVDGTGDPGEHFAWFENELQAAKESDQQVYIMGHIPPGYFELVDYKYWFYEHYNEEFIRIVSKYGDIILGQFFAHHHTDTFRLVLDKNTGQAVSSIWIAPGVTPWMTTLPGVENGANNPGIRLYEYEKTTAVPTDYLQYYLDIRQANGDGFAIWDVEYRFTDAYNVTDLSLDSMTLVVENLEKDPMLLQKYSIFNSVSYSFRTCSEVCRRNHLCAIKYLDIESYTNCSLARPSVQTNVASGCGVTCITAVVIVAVSLIFIIAFVIIYKRHKEQKQSSQQTQDNNVEVSSPTA